MKKHPVQQTCAMCRHGDVPKKQHGQVVKQNPFVESCMAFNTSWAVSTRLNDTFGPVVVGGWCGGGRLLGKRNPTISKKS